MQARRPSYRTLSRLVPLRDSSIGLSSHITMLTVSHQRKSLVSMLAVSRRDRTAGLTKIIAGALFATSLSLAVPPPLPLEQQQKH